MFWGLLFVMPGGTHSISRHPATTSLGNQPLAGVQNLIMSPIEAGPIGFPGAGHSSDSASGFSADKSAAGLPA
jgi:hypothetical protein